MLSLKFEITAGAISDEKNASRLVAGRNSAEIRRRAGHRRFHSSFAQVLPEMLIKIAIQLIDCAKIHLEKVDDNILTGTETVGDEYSA
uniref:Uncharacterized protein n=1 Tax=Romanomermis culicivorax TaxID=13658 RepID=A0A915KP84_ROMCU